MPQGCGKSWCGTRSTFRRKRFAAPLRNWPAMPSSPTRQFDKIIVDPIHGDIQPVFGDGEVRRGDIKRLAGGLHQQLAEDICHAVLLVVNNEGQWHRGVSSCRQTVAYPESSQIAPKPGVTIHGYTRLCTAMHGSFSPSGLAAE